MVIGSEGRRWLRRVLGAGLCCAGLVLAGVPGTTDGAPMPPANPPDSGGASQAATADGPLPQCDPCPWPAAPPANPRPPAGPRPGSGGSAGSGSAL
ncbi:MAG: hypothetical protein JO345_29285 [Streptosporangiaceae bacterium]|nr:hypothetical protein [Streptosporangiaceae bacterium]